MASTEIVFARAFFGLFSLPFQYPRKMKINLLGLCRGCSNRVPPKKRLKVTSWTTKLGKCPREHLTIGILFLYNKNSYLKCLMLAFK